MVFRVTPEELELLLEDELELLLLEPVLELELVEDDDEALELLELDVPPGACPPHALMANAKQPTTNPRRAKEAFMGYLRSSRALGSALIIIQKGIIKAMQGQLWTQCTVWVSLREPLPGHAPGGGPTT